VPRRPSCTVEPEFGSGIRSEITIQEIHELKMGEGGGRRDNDKIGNQTELFAKLLLFKSKKEAILLAQVLQPV
jgi:hypothetical protein